MATVKTGDTVLMKVVAGQDGDRVKNVADMLKQNWPVSAQILWGRGK